MKIKKILGDTWNEIRFFCEDVVFEYYDIRAYPSAYWVMTWFASFGLCLFSATGISKALLVLVFALATGLTIAGSLAGAVLLAVYSALSTFLFFECATYDYRPGHEKQDSHTIGFGYLHILLGAGLVAAHLWIF